MITKPTISANCDQENIQFVYDLSYFCSENIFPVLLSAACFMYKVDRSATSGLKLSWSSRVALPRPVNFACKPGFPQQKG